jgi:glutathione S-transferase
MYGRGTCHLCEEMALALSGLGLEYEEVDVDSDATLAERYGDRVPVLVDAAGREICHARLDAAALRARLGLE